MNQTIRPHPWYVHSYVPGVAQGDWKRCSQNLGVLAWTSVYKACWGAGRDQGVWKRKGSGFGARVVHFHSDTQPCSCQRRVSQLLILGGEGSFFFFFKSIRDGFFSTTHLEAGSIYTPTIWEYSQRKQGGEWSGWISWRKGLCLSSVTRRVGSAAVARKKDSADPLDFYERRLRVPLSPLTRHICRQAGCLLLRDSFVILFLFWCFKTQFSAFLSVL